jgi:hypothetical protein
MTVRLLAIAGCLMLGCATAGKEQPPGPSTDAPLTTTEDAPPVVGEDANNCANQPCDILTQCGCAANKACDVDTSDLDGPACRNVAAAPKPEGGVCGSNLTNCEPGLVCLGGFCKKYCDANSDCAAPRGQCVIDIVNGSTQQEIPNIPDVCSSGCDPSNNVAGGCTGTNTKCGIFQQTHNGQTFGISDCTVSGAGTAGANCKVGTQGDDKLCAPDHVCVTDGTNFTCEEVCNKTANTGCSTGICTSFGTPFLILGVEYGICQ